MQVRYSAVRGSRIVEEDSLQTIGYLQEPLIHPDAGTIEGFFVAGVHPEVPEEAFLSSSDILAWGTTVHVRSIDRLAPPDDLVRLQSLLRDPRRIFGQPIRIRGTARTIGRCVDVQFDTRRLTLQWLFPKRWWMMRRPIAVSEIVEVTPEAIWIADPLRGVREEEQVPAEEDGSRVPLVEKPAAA